MLALLIVLIVLAIPSLIAILTSVFQWVWNFTMPEIFGLKLITFWQAFRLLILAGFLFGSGSLISLGLSFGG
jgi:hypothetical protein